MPCRIITYFYRTIVLKYAVDVLSRGAHLPKEAHASIVPVLTGEGVKLLRRDADNIGSIQVRRIVAVASDFLAH